MTSGGRSQSWNQNIVVSLHDSDLDQIIDMVIFAIRNSTKLPIIPIKEVRKFKHNVKIQAN